MNNNELHQQIQQHNLLKNSDMEWNMETDKPYQLLKNGLPFWYLVVGVVGAIILFHFL